MVPFERLDDADLRHPPGSSATKDEAYARPFKQALGNNSAGGVYASTIVGTQNKRCIGRTERRYGREKKSKKQTCGDPNRSISWTDEVFTPMHHITLERQC
jgi:hypothetical protein